LQASLPQSIVLLAGYVQIQLLRQFALLDSTAKMENLSTLAIFHIITHA
jgi:hypothetical protein